MQSAGTREPTETTQALYGSPTTLRESGEECAGCEAPKMRGIIPHGAGYGARRGEHQYGTRNCNAAHFAQRGDGVRKVFEDVLHQEAVEASVLER